MGAERINLILCKCSNATKKLHRKLQKFGQSSASTEIWPISSDNNGDNDDDNNAAATAVADNNNDDDTGAGDTHDTEGPVMSSER